MLAFLLSRVPFCPPIGCLASPSICGGAASGLNRAGPEIAAFAPGFGPVLAGQAPACLGADSRHSYREPPPGRAMPRQILAALLLFAGLAVFVEPRRLAAAAAGLETGHPRRDRSADRRRPGAAARPARTPRPTSTAPSGSAGPSRPANCWCWCRRAITAPGFRAISPFVTDDGRRILVDRGFVRSDDARRAAQPRPGRDRRQPALARRAQRVDPRRRPGRQLVVRPRRRQDGGASRHRAGSGDRPDSDRSGYPAAAGRPPRRSATSISNTR